MRKMKEIKYITIIAFLLMIGPISWIVYGEDSKEITYTIQEELLDEGKKAKLTVEISTNQAGVEIKSVTLPDQRVMENTTSINYEVEENREYRFIVDYIVVKENEEQEKEEIEKKEEIVYQERNLQQIQIEKEVIEKPMLESKAGAVPLAAGDVTINVTNFPDDNFRAWLTNPNNINGYGADYVLTKNEISLIVDIRVTNANISSLAGIGYFTNLKILYCYTNNLTSIDVTKNKLLTLLNCQRNQLTSLNVANNTALTGLFCQENKISKLGISKNTLLERLSCYTNNLTELDISSNPKLYDLRCQNNKIESLDLSKHSLITTLYCDRNKLLTLNLNNNKVLSTVSIDRQTREIPMTFSNGQWKSNANINYGINSIGNKYITYNKTTGQFTTRYANNPSSNFSTNCKDGNGTVHQMTGTLSFIYQGFVPVSNITGAISSTTAGATVPLSATVAPTNASEKTISWSIKNAGTTGASISNSSLTTTSPGTLVITATVAGGTLTGPYTKDFTITVYGNASSLTCSYVGTKGKNGWYISDVTVHPPSNHQISMTLNSGYTNSLIFTASTTPIVYLKDIATGVLYSAKTLTPIKIDKVDPVISGIVDNGSAIATSKTVTVQDDNLDSVVLFVSDSLNGLQSAIGSPQTISNTSSTITLSAVTKDQYFRIEAEDEAGLKTVYSYTLITPTYEVEVQDIYFPAVDYNYSSVKGVQLNINVNIGNSPATITSIVSSDTSKFVVSGSGTNWTVTPVLGLPSGKHSVQLITTYDGGRIATSIVEMVVRVKDPIALISFPKTIDMERIRGDNLFEATKEEWVSLKTTTDTSIYPLDFYIMTEPNFPIFHTVDSDEWFKVQVYDSLEKRHQSLSNPIAILNGSHRSEKFYIKAFKDIARQRGNYKGKMIFKVGYGGPP